MKLSEVQVEAAWFNVELLLTPIYRTASFLVSASIDLLDNNLPL